MDRILPCEGSDKSSILFGDTKVAVAKAMADQGGLAECLPAGRQGLWRPDCSGGMAEWSNATVSKTVGGFSPARVRVSLPPPPSGYPKGLRGSNPLPSANKVRCDKNVLR